MMTVNCIGESPLTFLRQPFSSIRLTIKKPAMARNTARAGPGTSVHLTETCEADQPHLLIHVATTPAPESDVSMTEVIQADLQEAQMLPSQHLLDTGYINADVLASSQHRFGIEVVSPAHPDVKWQANTNQGIDASQFVIDWEHKQATCPQGKTSVSWTPTFDPRQHEVIKIRFSTKDCQTCPVLALCTSSKSRAPRRLLSVRPQQPYEALQQLVSCKRPKNFPGSMLCVRGSRPRFLKECAPLACVALAILVWTRPISSMLASLPLSTWFARLPG